MKIRLCTWKDVVDADKKIHFELINALALLGISIEHDVQWDDELDEDDNEVNFKEAVHNVIKLFNMYKVYRPRDCINMLELVKQNVEVELSAYNLLPYIPRIKAVVQFYSFNRFASASFVEETPKVTRKQLLALIDNIYKTDVNSSRPKKLANTCVLPEFDCMATSWMPWKHKAEAMLRAAGVYKILHDADHAELHPELNEIVAGLLQTAFISKNPSLSLTFIYNQGIKSNGFAIWQRIVEYYENGTMLQSLLRDQDNELRKLSYAPGRFESYTAAFLTIVNSIEMIKERAAELGVDVDGGKDLVNTYLVPMDDDKTLTTTCTMLRERNAKTVWDCAVKLKAHLAAVHRTPARGDHGEQSPNKSYQKKNAKQSTNGNAPKDDSKDVPVPKSQLIKTLSSYAKSMHKNNPDKAKQINAALEALNSGGKQGGKQGKYVAQRRRNVKFAQGTKRGKPDTLETDEFSIPKDLFDDADSSIKSSKRRKKSKS